MKSKSEMVTWTTSLTPREFETLLSRAATLAKTGLLQLVKLPKDPRKSRRPPLSFLPGTASQNHCLLSWKSRWRVVQSVAHGPLEPRILVRVQARQPSGLLVLAVAFIGVR
jgi:hypothetical protein